MTDKELEKIIKGSKIYRYAWHNLIRLNGNSSLNPDPMINKLLDEGLSELITKLKEK